MTRADQLRSLVKEATRGPWRFVPDSDEYIVFAPQEHPGHAAGHGETPANTRLMALAPQLAELVADMAEALAAIQTHTRFSEMADGEVRFMQVASVFVRVAALFPEERE